MAKLSDRVCSDNPDIGSKAASLGRLARAGFPVPNGFVITMRAYERFMAANNLGSGSTPEMVLAAPFPAEVAGVAFTANPVTGDRTETLVSAVRGLGDRLVSGEASPDEWIVRDGRATPRSAPEGAIDADKARAVAHLARRAEAHFAGEPQDIEWAVADGEVFLLQARPITTLSDLKPAQVEVAAEPPPGFWHREASHAPVPWTPMSRFWIFGPRNAALKRMFDEFGFLLEAMEIREIGGWEYWRLVPLGGKDRPAPPAWLMPLMIRLVPQLRQRVNQCVAAVRADMPGQLLHEWEARWQPDLAARAAQLRDVELSSLSDVELDEHTARAVALIQDGIEIHFLLHGAVGLALADLVFTARDLLNWDEAQVYEMLNGLFAKSTEPSRRLADLAATAGQRPAVRSLLEQVDDHTLDRIAEVDAEFAAAFSAYQREYGYRCLRYEIADPTLVERPNLVLSLIRDQVVLGFDPSAAGTQLEGQRASVVAVAREALARRTAEERRRFDRALARAEKAYPVREDNEFHTASAPLALVRVAVL